MNDLVNLLQTLALVAVLVLTFAGLGWIVYAFNRFAVAFDKMVKALEELTKTAVTVADPARRDPRDSEDEPLPEDEAAPVETKRYACHRCRAKLPENPMHSVIKEAVTFLVFKCRRCGKETEVDPETAQPISENK